MTSKHTALHIIGAILVLLLGLQSALAQTYEGETPVDMARGMADENGDIVRFRSLTIRWRFDGLMGEPLRQFAGRYEHHSPPWVELGNAPVCFAQRVVSAFVPKKIEPDMVSEGVLDGVDLYTHSRFRMIIQPNSGVGIVGGPGRTIQHYFGVDSFSQGTDYGPSVPGSPEWDRLFQIGSVGSEDIPWLSEAQARELFRGGFTVSRIDMVEPKYALALVKASYERHFRSKPCGDRPVEPLAEEEGTAANQIASAEDTPPDQAEPQTAAERLDAMLNRMSKAREGQVRADLIASIEQDRENSLDLCEGSRPLPPDMSQVASSPTISTSAGQTGDVQEGTTQGVNSVSSRGIVTLAVVIDTSGSMEGSRLASAKSAAIETVRRAHENGRTEYIVYSFSGSCEAPDIGLAAFDADINETVRFINGLSAGGGTPIGPAISAANRHIDLRKSPNSYEQMVIVLADGEDGCGTLEAEVANLKSSGILFRHETIGLEMSDSYALENLARVSGGNYHDAPSTAQLGATFQNVMDEMEEREREQLLAIHERELVHWESTLYPQCIASAESAYSAAIAELARKEELARQVELALEPLRDR